MPDQPLNKAIVGGRVRVNPPPAAGANDDERDINVDNSGNVNVNVVGGSGATVTANQGLPNTPANAWPVLVEDGSGNNITAPGAAPLHVRVDQQGPVMSDILKELKRLTLLLSLAFNLEVSDNDLVMEPNYQ